MVVLRGPFIRRFFALPSSLFFVCSSLLVLLDLFFGYFFRVKEGDGVSGDEVLRREDDFQLCKQEEDESPKLFFSFKYQTYRGDESVDFEGGFMKKEFESAGEKVVDAASNREAEKESEDFNAKERIDVTEHLAGELEIEEEEERVPLEDKIWASSIEGLIQLEEIEEDEEEEQLEIEEEELIQLKENSLEIEEEEVVLLGDENSESVMEELIQVEENASGIIEEEQVLLADENSESAIEESIITRESTSEIIAEEIYGDSGEDPDLGNEFFAPNSGEFLSENDFGGEALEEFDLLDSGEESGDILWEQQEFMEQLKMDMKKARSTGLPTIEEEDEYPNVNEVFTPWKINENFRHEYRISELRKFYRIYKQRMRKLDILNFQKRIALPSLQSRLVHEDAKGRGSLSIRRRRVSDSDSARNAIGEVLEEFEKIYVAHTCLSWEMLHWQYIKMVELWETEKLRIQSYNEAAKEYQLFQILIERFLENEAFDGPRIENYTNKRSASQKLLQIPVIREDRSKERKMGEEAIRSDELIEIMEGAIRTMWRFIKTDTSGEGRSRSEDPMVAETRSMLWKKEKRLKEVVNSGSRWMVWKRQEERREDSACFFAEVEMKLVSRVLRMQKVTREQLEWCTSKLDNIHFVGKKLHLNPSFCLFPCSSA